MCKGFRMVVGRNFNVQAGKMKPVKILARLMVAWLAYTGSIQAMGESTERFPVSFWCGPPEKFVTLERYQQIANAGFTHVFPSCGGMSVEGNKKGLELAEKVGLKVFLQDGRM